MKRILTILAGAFLLVASAAAQQRSADEYANRYAMLVNRLGADGVGVETLIQNWEADYPDDLDMLMAKWAFCFTKAQRTEVVQKDQEKFLGGEPVLSLKDSLDRPVHYFQEIFFDDELFTQAMQAVDKAIRLAPLELSYRFTKITSLISYEKESPELATSEMNTLLSYNYTKHPAWVHKGEPVTADEFEDAVQEICYTMYAIGSPVSYESFRTLSQKMIDFKSKNVVFQGNLGTYYLVYKQNYKEALKYYNKVLKARPDDYGTIKNCVVLSRRDGNKKNERKYLLMLAKYAPTEVERASAATRAETLK